MRYDQKAASNDWELLEVVRGERRPCSDAYHNANEDDLTQIFRELRLIRAAGVPPDKLKGAPDVEPWTKKCKNDHHTTTFYVLKAKPSGWRLYFYPRNPDGRQLIFLYAVNKKQNDRNQEDFDKLCHAKRKLENQGFSLESLFVPDR